MCNKWLHFHLDCKTGHQNLWSTQIQQVQEHQSCINFFIYITSQSFFISIVTLNIMIFDSGRCDPTCIDILIFPFTKPLQALGDGHTRKNARYTQPCLWILPQNNGPQSVCAGRGVLQIPSPPNICISKDGRMCLRSYKKHINKRNIDLPTGYKKHRNMDGWRWIPDHIVQMFFLFLHRKLDKNSVHS